MSERQVTKKEFLQGLNLSFEAQAGFESFIRDIDYNTSEGWQKLYEEYKNRKIRIN